MFNFEVKMKKNKYLKRIVYTLAGVLLLVSSWEVTASQTGAELEKAGEKIDKLEEQKEEAQEKLGQLESQKGGLQGELAGLNQQLSDVSAQINDLEVQIKEKKSAIKQAKKDLKEAKNTKNQQYESMKLRIQFMYERGNADMMSVLLSSESMSDFLNKAEYVEEINRYDRQMLDTYEGTCQQVSEKKQNLKEEKDQLVSMQDSMEQKEEEVGGLIAKTQESIAGKQAEISETQSEVEEYENQIAKMKAYEEELERKKAEEAKRLAAEQKKKEQQQKQQAAGQGGGGKVTANAGDLAMLAALVECEAGGESYEGQWAVASVVVNRVRSGRYPNTVSGVIYQSGQFSPVASGRFAIVLARGARGSCVQAANAALSGSTNVNALSFCRASSGVPGTVIGNHVFY